MPEGSSFRAFLEYRREDGSTAFARTPDVMQNPDLQRRLLPADGREYRRMIDRLRKNGRLLEIPYIGPIT